MQSISESYPIWTKKDIIHLLDPENKDKVDSRVPLSKHKYSAVWKILSLRRGPEEVEVKFNYEELLALRDIPEHVINSVEKNGCKQETKEGKK